MRITFSEFKKKRVETQSGVYVGKVADLILDIDQYSIVQLKVSRAFKREHLLIHPGQIKRIEEKRIIVLDSIVRREAAEAEIPLSAKVESISMRKSG